MKNKLSFNFFVLFVLVLFSSCKTSKDLIYLQDLTPQEKLVTSPLTLNEYQIRKGDNLYVQVTSVNPEVSMLFNPSSGSGTGSYASQMYNSLSGQYIYSYQVDQDGNIDLPVVGLVDVEGQTIPEAKTSIYNSVNEYFKEVSVSVKLLSFKYTVMGEVNSPGIYYNYNNLCSIFEGISNANGTTDYASLESVTVLRETKDGIQSYNVDLSDKSLITSEVYYLQPNDVIYIAPDRYKNTRLNSSLYSLALSTVSTLIVILGFLAN